MAKIKLSNMQFYAYHGCFEEEQTVGTHFVVECDLDAMVYEAATTDNLEKTINYQTVYRIVKAEMEKPSRLLENVAYRILTSLYHYYPNVKNGNVYIAKINPSLGGKVGSASVKMGLNEIYNLKRVRNRKKKNEE